ncbi:MAG: hypothetical protein ABIL46_03625 [candidate division WOR-3 bacterium]
MIILFLINLHIGFECGIDQPIIGLDYNLNSGAIFKIYIGKQDLNHSLYLNLVVSGSYYQGKNPGYSFNIYSLGLMIRKLNWRLTPFVDCGIDYITRELNKNREWGLGFSYTFGFLINFYYENINIYPSLYYDGVTDFRAQAGSLGIKLGIKYEF